MAVFFLVVRPRNGVVSRTESYNTSFFSKTMAFSYKVVSIMHNRRLPRPNRILERYSYLGDNHGAVRLLILGHAYTGEICVG